MDFFYLYILSYILGSIPFGMIFIKITGKGDIRQIGSGNIGATNVLRSGSKSLALLTLVADSLKGAIPVLLAKYFYEADVTRQCFVGGIAIIAHIFPIWLKFKGGKGVATTIGVYLALCPLVGISVLLTWLLAAKIARISSLSALIAFFMTPFYVFLLIGKTAIILFTITVYLLIIWTHRENIKRILYGKESQL